MSLSFGEIFVIIIISFLLLKPKDIIHIIKNFRQMKNFFSSYHKSFSEYIENQISEIDKNISIDDKESINFYIKKIVELDKKYEGEYTLESVKLFYHKAILEDHSQNNFNKE